MSFVAVNAIKGAASNRDRSRRFLDNIFVERIWRPLRYECVYLHAWETGSEAKAGVRKWIEFYNYKRPHSALGGKLPAVVYWQRIETTNPDQQERRVA
ncbi:integrase core domain-containing protein [Planktotalea lamellibrachiae]|nr:integrase core domain-containing protein [Aliiroseovarius lamellibrachiae]